MAHEFWLPDAISYSALSLYAECGEKYRLSRGYHLGGQTWFATIAGTAIHNITQVMDLQEIGLELNGIPAEFKTEFDRLLEIEEGRGNEVLPSGRVLKKIGKNGGPNKKDYDWWLVYGPKALDLWTKWKQSNGWFLLRLPDGKPGIEVAFDQPLGDGGPRFRGYIDRVYVNMDGEVIVVDLKSGKLPAGHLQLASYGLGLKQATGITARRGSYWMAHDGQLTSVVDLESYSEEYVNHLYALAWKGITEGIYLPNVTSNCHGCPVRDFCRGVAGKHSMSIPVVTELKHRAVVSDPADKE